MLEAYVTQFLESFRPLAFPEGFGFDTFSREDVMAYLGDETRWNFQFNKTPGRGILYSVSHTDVRRSLLNGLEKEMRLSIMAPKFKYFKVLPKLHILFEDDSLQVQDVLDIGMGHSVYRIDLAGKNGQLSSVVIKQEEWPSHSFFSQVLRIMGFPVHHEGHVIDDRGCWEISSYLGSETAQRVLLGREASDDMSLLLDQLAAQAALGDVFGRGDRHFENYLFYQKQLYPIDVSFLFWEGNEDWVRKYIAGGMMEMSSLSIFSEQPDRLQASKQRFFDVYFKTLESIKLCQSKLEMCIEHYFGVKDPDTCRKVAYVRSRLLDISDYFLSQKKLYEEAFEEMQVRRIQKLRLQELVLASSEILTYNAWLKMYYLADRDRLSTFYLLEDHPDIQF
ncbi:MAG: hypothetical protein EXS67_00760 [Candidatus Margulisbacteria bacterium]|nr:hypothetical protein [Candidatus Margulisiibacteriota bacterium]